MKTLEEKRIERLEKISGKKIVWGKWSYWENVPYIEISEGDWYPMAGQVSGNGWTDIYRATEKYTNEQEKEILDRCFFIAAAIGNGASGAVLASL